MRENNPRMMENGLLRICLSWLLVVLLFSILFLNYAKNTFDIVDMTWFEGWSSGSESLVTKSVQTAREQGIGYSYGLLGDYKQQVGLQGMFFRVLDRVLNRPSVPVEFFHMLTVFILCIVLFVFLYWAKREFGLGAAAVGYIALFFSRWMIVSARNLYWVTFTQFLPFLSILLLAQRTQRRSVGLHWFGLAAFLTIFIKAACGYEMISSVMVAMEIPLFYYAYKDHWGWKVFLKRFLVCGICALLAFFAALAVNLLQQAGYYGSLDRAINFTKNIIGKRTGAYGFVTDDELITASLEASKWSVLKTYLISGSPLIGNLHMISILFIAGIATALTFMGKRYSESIWTDRRKLHGLCIAMWVSFLGPISWHILAAPHSYIHTHINYILWSFPCILLVGILCGNVISRIYADHRSTANKAAVCSAIVCGALAVYFYADSCKVGTKYLKLVQEDGVQIEHGRYADIYYYEENLYYLIGKINVKEKVFLHLYPAEGSMEFANELGFANSDFSFADRELKTPVWEDTKIARMPLDKDFSVSEIDTGQYTSAGRVWEKRFKLSDYIETPAEIVPDSLSDDNWTNGVHKGRKALLMKAEDELALHLLEGRTLRTESGKTVHVKQVLKKGDWIHIILDGSVDASDGYPHAFSVVDN